MASVPEPPTVTWFLAFPYLGVQTVPHSEHAAVEACLCRATPPVHMVTDCRLVKDSWELPWDFLLSSRCSFASHWRRVHALVHDWGADQLRISWTPAHYTEDEYRQRGLDVFWQQGNSEADKAAGVGAIFHGLYGHAEDAAVAREAMLKRWAIFAGKIVAEYLALLPGGEKAPRRFAQARPMRAPRVRRHRLLRRTGGWQCADCGQRARTAGYRRKLLTLACPGAGPLARSGCGRAGLGHLLWTDGFLFWCSRCGCFASVSPRGLGKACPRTASKAGRQNLRRIRAGRHPHSGAALGPARLAARAWRGGGLPEPGRQAEQEQEDRGSEGLPVVRRRLRGKQPAPSAARGGAESLAEPAVFFQR